MVAIAFEDEIHTAGDRYTTLCKDVHPRAIMETLGHSDITRELERNFRFSLEVRRTSVQVPRTESGKYRHIIDARKLTLERRNLGW